MTDKVKISGEMLSAVRNAERALAKQEAKELENALPEDHPLRAEVERQKAMLDGDLSGLPPGHPLLRALELARKNLEAKKAVESNKEQTRAEIKKAKKVDAKAIKREARRIEDEQTDRRRMAAKEVNDGVEGVLKDVRDLFQRISANEEILNTDPFSRVKVARLKRLLSAIERGVVDCRIARI